MNSIAFSWILYLICIRKLYFILFFSSLEPQTPNSNFATLYILIKKKGSWSDLTCIRNKKNRIKALHEASRTKNKRFESTKWGVKSSNELNSFFVHSVFVLKIYILYNIFFFFKTLKLVIQTQIQSQLSTQHAID